MTSGKTFEDKGFYSLNDRRRVFREFPNGAAPLTGLLSLMSTEPTDNPKFGWFEKRFLAIRTQLIAGTNSPFAASGFDIGYTTDHDYTAADVTRLQVADSSQFRVNQTVWLKDLPKTGGGTVQLKGTVTAIVDATKMEIRVHESIAGVICTNNTTTSGTAGPVDAYVICTGSSSPEGNRSTGNGRLIIPINPENYTQIQRDRFSFTGTSLKIPANFDKTGIYKEKAKDNAVDHMVGLEQSFLFGARSIVNAVNSEGDTVPTRTTGGIMWFLEEWERAAGGTIGYRPGGAALTLDTEDDKRIINNASGTMTEAVWDGYVERAFRQTNNKSFEKLVLCGSGALSTINQLVKDNVVVNKNMGAESTYGMNVTTVETPHGILHFKSHPLFTENPALKYTMMIIDVGNLRYRPLQDRDTVLLKNRQHNDEDGRKDEWFTEAGLEVRYPESHMVIHNFKAVTVS